MAKRLKQDFTPEDWAEKLRNSSYQRAKRGNREAWLTNLAKAMRPHFAAIGCELPAAVRISFGWTARARIALGECWQSKATADEHFEIFISPLHGNMGPRTLAATLVHELIHTRHRGHGKGFQADMAALGLEGPPTATTGGPGLWAWLDPLLDEAGPFPGSSINLADRAKKQTTRMLKCECTACGLIFRASRTTLQDAALDGLLNCPSPRCGHSIEINLEPEEEE